MSTAVRRACFDAHKQTDETGRIYLTCYICKGRIDPGRELWEAEHVVPKNLGGSDRPDNVLPAHKKCHQPKTSKDITAHAKGIRVSEKHYGIKRAKGFRKPSGVTYDWTRRRYVGK